MPLSFYCYRNENKSFGMNSYYYVIVKAFSRSIASPIDKQTILTFTFNVETFFLKTKTFHVVFIRFWGRQNYCENEHFALCRRGYSSSVK